MTEPDTLDWFRRWPPASFRQRLVALGAVAVLIAALYFIFSALGW